MDLNDGSQYRVVTDPARHMRERQVFVFRAASAAGGTQKYVDTAFARHRSQLAAMPLLCMYQFAFQGAGTPEVQANFFLDALGRRLAANEAVMLDIEAASGIADPVGFMRRWLAVVEPALKTRAWIYVPGALAAKLTRIVTGDRLVMAPHYSATPAWPHDLHQYTDHGYFPGCSDPSGGDVSRTSLPLSTLLARSKGPEMATSYNGWSAGPGWSVAGGQLEALVVAGEPFSPGVRAGDVHDVLEYVANQLHHRVEPVVRADWHQADDWGYSYRANTNNPSQLSCHASATAIDYNATRHANGKSGTWTVAQKAEIARILAEVNNVVRNLTGYDEMHFEIKGTASQVAAAAAKVRNPSAPPAASPVLATQRAINLVDGEVDGIWGEQTERGVNTVREAINGKFPYGVAEAQTRVGTNADGQWGAMSQAALTQTIRELQAAWGAAVDGQWGANTESRWTTVRKAYYTALKR